MKILIFILITFILSGIAKAIGDRISWTDLFKKFTFWSRKYTGQKDKNQDGKISIREKFVPWDGWHLMEWIKILPFGILCAILFDLLQPCNQQIYAWYWFNALTHYLYLFSLAIIYTAAYNYAFLIVYGILPRFFRK